MKSKDLVFDERYERLIIEKLPKFGVSVLICIDSTVLGPALGGTRFRTYSNFEEAMIDAVRLARGMTYKAANLWEDGYHLGGGKAVIMGNPETQKNPELLQEYGHIVNRLMGMYITAEDMNTNVEDMGIIAETTTYVVGCSKGDGSSGNPAPYTAEGCLAAIRAALNFKFNSTDVKGRVFVFQGAGEVGFRLARLLKELGGRIVACDINQRAIERIRHEVGAIIVKPEEIFAHAGDVFVPCAGGGVLNDETILILQCPIVAGPANNQLANPARHGQMLAERGITYVVDFIGNAGGLIAAADELLAGRRFNEERVRRNIRHIEHRVFKNLGQSRASNIHPHEIAIQASGRLLEGMRKLKKELKENQKLV